jgi:hypothetical protein
MGLDDQAEKLRQAQEWANSPQATPDQRTAAAEYLMREILEAVCMRDGISTESAVVPGEPARNYEFALRLGIGHVFGLTAGEEE